MHTEPGTTWTLCLFVANGISDELEPFVCSEELEPFGSGAGTLGASAGVAAVPGTWGRVYTVVDGYVHIYGFMRIHTGMYGKLRPSELLLQGFPVRDWGSGFRVPDPDFGMGSGIKSGTGMLVWGFDWTA